MESMKKIEFERNKEFDRPFLDSIREKDKFITTNECQGTRVLEYFRKNSPGSFDVSEQTALTGNNSVRTLLSRDNISGFFSYPEFEKATSSSRDAFKLDSESRGSRREWDTKNRIRRTEYSDYNEQRIKFGLKFLIESMFLKVHTTGINRTKTS